VLEGDRVDEALTLLGGVLAERGETHEIVVIGGGALLLLGLISWPTKDLDVVAMVEDGKYVSAQPLPMSLVDAVRDVGRELGLASDWVDVRPTSLIEDGLPVGFNNRVESLVYGTLTVHVASRFDQIHLKLLAAVYLWSQWSSREKHAVDLQRLAPTRDELITAGRWVCQQDSLPEFPKIVAEVLKAFGVEDAEAHF
jgi:hypothetical protein